MKASNVVLVIGQDAFSINVTILIFWLFYPFNFYGIAIWSRLLRSHINVNILSRISTYSLFVIYIVYKYWKPIWKIRNRLKLCWNELLQSIMLCFKPLYIFLYHLRNLFSINFFSSASASLFWPSGPLRMSRNRMRPAASSQRVLLEGSW